MQKYIVPIHKKGIKEDLNNYRPICLLNTFSKIVEKVIKVRIVEFVEKNFGFDQVQYGFQKCSSTLGATVDLLEYVLKEIDRNNYVTVVFVDLEKLLTP